MGRRSLVRHTAAIAESEVMLALNADQALDNFWTIPSTPLAAAQTIAAGPTAVNVAVVLVTPKLSGNLDVDVDVGYSSNTAAHPVTWTLTALQATVAANRFAVGGTATAVGFGGIVNVHGAGFVNGASAPMPVTVVGGDTTLQLDQKIIGTVAGLLTANGSASQYYGAHALYGNFDGNQMAFVLSVNATAADIITIAQLSMTVTERPWG